MKKLLRQCLNKGFGKGAAKGCESCVAKVLGKGKGVASVTLMRYWKTLLRQCLRKVSATVLRRIATVVLPKDRAKANAKVTRKVIPNDSWTAMQRAGAEVQRKKNKKGNT